MSLGPVPGLSEMVFDILGIRHIEATHLRIELFGLFSLIRSLGWSLTLKSIAFKLRGSG